MRREDARVSTDEALAVLRRLALHYPRSEQARMLLDETRAEGRALAEDYAQDCRRLTVAQFIEAVDRARPLHRFFPTSADVLAAHGQLENERALAQRTAMQQAARQAEQAQYSPEQMARSAAFARIFTERRQQGLPPLPFDEARRLVERELGEGGGVVQ